MRNVQHMAVRIPTNLSLPRDLIREVDDVAGPRNRSAFVEDAVRTALRREQLRLAAKSTSGAWKDRGDPAWEEPDGVLKWVRALRAEETGPDASS
jgi:predicted transcriptional regulator